MLDVDFDLLITATLVAFNVFEFEGFMRFLQNQYAEEWWLGSHWIHLEAHSRPWRPASPVFGVIKRTLPGAAENWDVVESLCSVVHALSSRRGTTLTRRRSASSIKSRDFRKREKTKWIDRRRDLKNRMAWTLASDCQEKLKCTYYERFWGGWETAWSRKEISVLAVFYW